MGLNTTVLRALAARWQERGLRILAGEPMSRHTTLRIGGPADLFVPIEGGEVLAAAVALHNMPVGMAVGTTVAVQGICYASLLTAATIAFHNIPEGMSIAIPLLHDGSKPFSAIGVAALSGAPTVLGALLGYFIGNQTPLALSVAMSIAGGAMLYVVFFELLPEAYQQWRSKWAILATVVGFALGLLLIYSHLHVHVHPN